MKPIVREPPKMTRGEIAAGLLLRAIVCYASGERIWQNAALFAIDQALRAVRNQPVGLVWFTDKVVA